MSFFDNFTQLNKLDIKTQRANPTEMNFTMISSQIREKDPVDIYFINKRLTVALATKSRLCFPSLLYET